MITSLRPVLKKSRANSEKIRKNIFRFPLPAWEKKRRMLTGCNTRISERHFGFWGKSKYPEPEEGRRMRLKFKTLLKTELQERKIMHMNENEIEYLLDEHYLHFIKDPSYVKKVISEIPQHLSQPDKLLSGFYRQFQRKRITIHFIHDNYFRGRRKSSSEEKMG